MKCEYCDNTREIETDNNGPIVSCPVCEQSKKTNYFSTTAYVVKDLDGYAVKVNGKTVEYFSKYEDYAYTESKKLAAKLNKERLLT